MSDIERLQAELEASYEPYHAAKAKISRLAIELIKAIAKEHAPGATKVVLDDSDQEGGTYVFRFFADDEGNEVDVVDEDEVDNLIWGPVSDLDEDDVGDYTIEVA